MIHNLNLEAYYRFESSNYKMIRIEIIFNDDTVINLTRSVGKETDLDGLIRLSLGEIVYTNIGTYYQERVTRIDIYDTISDVGCYMFSLDVDAYSVIMDSTHKYIISLRKAIHSGELIKKIVYKIFNNEPLPKSIISVIEDKQKIEEEIKDIFNNMNFDFLTRYSDIVGEDNQILSWATFLLLSSDEPIDEVLLKLSLDDHKKVKVIYNES